MKEKKNRLPKVPKNRFSFALAAKRSSGAKRIFVIFEEDLSRRSQSFLSSLSKASQKAIEREKKRKAFLAKPGEQLYLSADDALLVGLGKQKGFHPEVFASALMSLGSGLSKQEQKELDIVLTAGLKKAIRSYEKKAKQIERDGSLLKLAKRSTDSASSKLDYVSRFELSDLLLQLVCSLENGAFSSRLLANLSTEENEEKKKTKKAKANKQSNSKEKSTKIHIALPELEKSNAKSLEEGRLLSEMLHRSRYLAHLPGNYLNPESYESYVRSLCKGLPVGLSVFGKKRLERQGFGGILSVGQGSSIPPRMLVLEYSPKRARNKRPFVLVGKGVTFDSGGISLKPSAEMHEMKFDMCGSALALHSLVLAARRKLPVRIVALIGLAENLPDGSAIKPGDVYTAYNGKTVEVQNTDAEGRLILADLLGYASKAYEPALMFEYSTLTGACIIALGHHVAGVMTPSDRVYKAIESASRRSLDRVWRLPHWSSYDEALKSDIADFRNIGGRPAGTISAMRFLQNFVGEGISWAHFDIAGAAWSGKAQGSQPAGATGWGLRLMNRFFTDLI